MASKKKKRALITGINGQDGSYLAEFLLGENYEVFGIMRRLSVPNVENISHLVDRVKIYDGDLLDESSIVRAIQDCRPDELYNLAAQSFVKSSWHQPIFTGEATAMGVIRVLEAIRNTKPDIKFYQASSSEMYGEVEETPQTETTRFHPRSPYGVAKVFGHWTTVNYRESFDIFACSGILFNHESPRRGLEFITRKITYGVACIAEGIKTSPAVNEEKESLVKNGKIKLGNLDARRDWGYAKDYVEAMWLMLQQKKPDDYVIATGENHSIKEFVQEAFKCVGVTNWQKYVQIDKRFFRPAEVEVLQGSCAKAKRVLGWKPKTKFKELVEIMVKADIDKLRNK
ncbi:MAG: GDP-mannose 4,6-dehydratase [Parcubacteria group bacterium]|nr:GDP-mannose 4,6-dehydratase [Parcubacteria group bacterium]